MIQVLARSKAAVHVHSPADIAGSSPAGDIDVCILCVLSGSGLRVGLSTRPVESFRLWCVFLCDPETLSKWRPCFALDRIATGK
jgi:hypothetical protein